MCRIYVSHNHWSIYEKIRSICPRVDVVPYYRLIIGGSMSWTISHIGLSVSWEDFGHCWSIS